MDASTPLSYLTFGLHGKLYGIKAQAVREIVLLPGLTPCVQAPVHVTGEFNYRGCVVPVIDLDIKFGRTPRAYRLNDTIIVFETAGALAGLVVNDVQDVKSISLPGVQELPGWVRRDTGLIEGEAKDESGLITLLNADELATGVNAPTDEPLPEGRVFLPSEALPEEAAAILAERARSFGRTVEDGPSGSTVLAVIRLAEEYFGIELSLVREFAEIRDLAPVPCCPAHVTGNMNLRGDILTVVDVRVLLHMPPGHPLKEAKAVVVEMEGLLAGILSDEVCEVVNPRPGDIAPASAALDPAGEGFVAGTVPYRGKMLCVLDLKKVLDSSILFVNEEVQT